MWPGFETDVKLCNDGIYLNIDTATKFVNQVTINQKIHSLLNRGYSRQDIIDMFDSSNLDVPRTTVITSYITKSYQVDGLTFDVTPRTHRFQWKHGGMAEEVTMVEYFKKKYNIVIDGNQPLLYVNNWQTDKIYLPTQLCNEASLPADFTQDTNKMRDIDGFKLKDP